MVVMGMIMAIIIGMMPYFSTILEGSVGLDSIHKRAMQQSFVEDN